MKIEELETLRMANELLMLMERKSISKSDLCRALTLKTFKPMDSVASFIALINDDGTVRIESSYGLSEYESATWKNFSLSDHRPLTNAIRENVPVWTDIEAGGLSDYPIINSSEYLKISRSQVIWPITHAGIPIGALGLLFNKSINISETAVQYLELIGRIVALALAAPVNFTNEIPITERAASKYDALTERESKVLAGIAAYLTNAQIAERLGFSESTVRQDTIQIYRKMGVDSRDEARKIYLESKSI